MANTAIYNALLQPPKTYQDYADEDAKRQANMLAIQSNQQNLLMGKQKLDEYQRGIQEQQTIRNALAALGPGATDDQRINALKNTGLASGFTQADALVKSGIERTKAQAEADKNVAEAKAKQVDTAHKMLDYGIQGLQTIGDPSTAERYINQGVTRGYWSMDDAQRMVAGMPKDPSQFGDWRVTQLRALLAAKDQLPKTGNVSMGGFERYYSTDPVTGKTTLTATEAKTQSPDNAASTAVQWAQVGNARDRLKFDKEQAGGLEYKQDADGNFIALPKKPAMAGPVTAVPVLSTDGKPVGAGAKLGEAQKKQITGIDSLGAAVDEYVKELDGWKKLDALSPDARARMGTKYNNMMLQAKEAYNLGVLNGPDYQILTSVVTDPLTFRGAVTSNDALSTQASELKRLMSKTRAAVAAGGKQPSNRQAIEGFGGTPAARPPLESFNR